MDEESGLDCDIGLKSFGVTSLVNLLSSRTEVAESILSLLVNKSLVLLFMVLPSIEDLEMNSRDEESFSLKPTSERLLGSWKMERFTFAFI